jgi:hypothetical protein
MVTIFGTVNRYINHDDGTKTLVLNKLTDDFGNVKKGTFKVDNQMTISCMRPKLGHRYMVKISEHGICETRKVNKNPRCGIFRRFKDDFHIIGGKHQGKKVSELDRLELTNYCVWLGQHSYNEMTIKNVLTILNNLD